MIFVQDDAEAVGELIALDGNGERRGQRQGAEKSGRHPAKLPQN
jgi:hypothetical protein